MTVPVARVERVVVVHGRPEPMLAAALRTAGLIPVIETVDDTTVWVPAGDDPSADRAVMAPTPPGPMLLTIAQAADALGIGRATVYETIRQGDFEVVHVGRAARVPAEAVDDLVARLRHQHKQRGPERWSAPTCSVSPPRSRPGSSVKPRIGNFPASGVTSRSTRTRSTSPVNR